MANICVVPQTVLIVDDHDGFRGAARELLEADGFVVVGEAADGRQALPRSSVWCLTLYCSTSRSRTRWLRGRRVPRRESSAPPSWCWSSSRDAVTYGGRVGRASVAGFLPKRELSGASLAGLLG